MPVLLALTVALLSSLMTAGMPGTTAFGSAFNPATTSVVLQPVRIQPRMVAEQVRRDDNLADQVANVAELPVAAAVPAVAFDLRVPVPDDERWRTMRIAVDGQPRAPPLS